MKLAGTGVWSFPLRYGDPAEAAEATTELEELGFSAVWIPDVGGPLFDALDSMLRATDRIVIASGILNLWMHTPQETAEQFSILTSKYGDRFLMGIGVSHAPAIDAIVEPGLYRNPLGAMVTFLDGLDAADTPVPRESRLLAALGPKMLGLAASRAGGAHPYLVSPEHTALAREALGPGALLAPEQTVIFCKDRQGARDIGAHWLGQYLQMPNYANSVQRLGFTREDVDTVSDRLFDSLIAWGDEDDIVARISEHTDAGADHVCAQVLTADLTALPRVEWRRLAAAVA
ncbi:probable F420-dependent oxidoreductase [Jatrophihabitans sp. GAS493]|uniref:LLM class F420-dependent oxidoreductase n=1 Tax=Jatrophihabitans sp. GAS493 TaxID=1907575 RepID=UPI000BB7E33B|nr:LLM class F420-dependent oxidoreductase [Jatrophihabitans sp. GAS493]SOD72154.1 probable F420-dependent oxidoreductase [Jatrophihabitans sp. GAS493]